MMMRQVACKPRVAPSAGTKSAVRSVVVRADKKENPYHDHNYHSSGQGVKDAGASKIDKQDQFEYQQERLEWRKKHQHGGDDNMDDRTKPAVNNMASDMSAEKRGPEVPDTSGHADSLSSPKNAIGKAVRKLTGAE